MLRAIKQWLASWRSPTDRVVVIRPNSLKRKERPHGTWPQG